MKSIKKYFTTDDFNSDIKDIRNDNLSLEEIIFFKTRKEAESFALETQEDMGSENGVSVIEVEMSFKKISKAIEDEEGQEHYLFASKIINY